MEFITNNSSQTKELGGKLTERISKEKLKKKAVIFGLIGDLGGGKTTFLQGFAKKLGIKEKILSPTFVIMKRFQILGSKFQFFYHVDCYRIKKPKEILKLGFKKLIQHPNNIVALEWAERVKKVLPKDVVWIKFKFLGENKRKILIN